MRLTTAEVAALTRGEVDGDLGLVLTGAEVDSRLVAPGDLFVALPGARSDGHSFVAAALAVARAALVRHDAELAPVPEGRALIRVADPLAAYHRLARRLRARQQWRVVAITGSVAKTTTKEFLAALLEPDYRVGVTAGNRNSTLGLPAQLLRQPAELQVFVAEAGMSRPGELDLLGGILRPEVLLYTRIAAAHTEYFADMKGVAAAKAELLGHLQPDGVLVVNAADRYQRGFAELTTARVLAYGTRRSPVHLKNLDDRGLRGSRFELVLENDSAEVELNLPGVHQAENLLAAAAAASVFGLSAAAVSERAASLEAAPRRGRLHRLDDGVVVVDDSYNASPAAVKKLLALLAVAPGRRVAVLGEMFELGRNGPLAHRRAGEQAAAACDLLVAVGGEAARVMATSAGAAGMAGDAVHHVPDNEAATALLREQLRADDVVLVKGSRGVGLDRSVDALIGTEAA